MAGNTTPTNTNEFNTKPISSPTGLTSLVSLFLVLAWKKFYCEKGACLLNYIHNRETHLKGKCFKNVCKILNKIFMVPTVFNPLH